MTEAKVTTDHDEIRRWAESRGGKPAVVASTRGKGAGSIVRLEFPEAPNAHDEHLAPISWEEFFARFDESQLALLFQGRTAGGERSNFDELVDRDTAEARRHGGHKAARHRDS